LNARNHTKFGRREYLEAVDVGFHDCLFFANRARHASRMVADDPLGTSDVKPRTETQDDQLLLLSTSPPTRTQWRLAVCVLGVLIGALLVTAPFARVPLTNTEVLLPAYAAAVFVNELITSALLLALFSVQRSRAVLVLSIGLSLPQITS
jgi:hypothetical protein